MKYRQLGRTGLKISAIGLGCGNFGGVGSSPAFFGQGESEAEAHSLLDEALDLGITLLDTADAYGGGRSEKFIGNWLRQKGTGVRDQLIISSKVFNPVGPGPNDRGLSRRHILQQVEASLRRLGTDRLDLYLIHEPDPETTLAETVRALDDLVRAGKVHYIGASNIPAWLLTKALWVSDRFNLHRFEWVQNSYSLLDRDDEREMLPLVADQGLGYTPFSPLAGGFLTGKYRYEERYPAGSRMTLRPEPYFHLWQPAVFAALDRLGEMAADLGVSMAGLSLAWLLGQPLVTAPIIGPRRPAHFTPVREALALHLTPDQLNEIGSLFPSQTMTGDG